MSRMSRKSITTKIVINDSYGGFGLTDAVMAEMYRRGYDGPELNKYFDIDRTNKYLVEAVENLPKDKVNALIVVEFEGPRYQVDEYDGWETILTPDTMHWELVDTPEMRKEYPEYFL